MNFINEKILKIFNKVFRKNTINNYDNYSGNYRRENPKQNYRLYNDNKGQCQ